MKGLITKLFTVFLISVFAITYSSASTVPQIKKPSIVFLSPEFPESDFFRTVTKIMQAAASSLGVSLEVVYGNDNPVNILEQGTQIINRKNKADYLVMVNDISSTPVLMKLAHDQGQKTFLFNGAIEAELYDRYHAENSASWFGSLLPDDEQSGYQLAKVLVTQARRKGIQDKDGKINIIAINGNHRSLVPKSREKGLKRFVNENADVKLLHVVNAYWSQDRAQGAVERLLKLYPETNIIWSASDWMALGAISGAETMQRRVGKDILICGIDWLPVSFDQINKDHLACSIGGHIFDGAWLMVLLHDQFNHLYPQYVQEQTHFTTVTSKNLSVIETIFKDELWKNIDFKKFSKAYNNNGPVTEFGSHLLIKELVNSKLLMNELN